MGEKDGCEIREGGGGVEAATVCYFYHGKVRGFCTLMSVATMIDVSANKIEKIGASLGFEPLTYTFHPLRCSTN